MMESSSARAVGSISRVAKSRFRDFKLVRNIFRRWPKAVAVTVSMASKGTEASGVGRGVRLDTVEATLGGGVNASLETLKAEWTSHSHWVITDKRPYALVCGWAVRRSATSV